MSDLPPTVPSWRERLDLLVNQTAGSPARVAGGMALAVAALVAVWFLLRQPTGPPPELALPMAAPASPAAEQAEHDELTELVVHVAGAVRAPGVYRVEPAARVADAIERAGGPSPDADLDRLNLAAPVVDGAQVYVPRRGEPAPATGTPAATSGPVDLNTATLEQLDALPGVGPATAKAIIDERTRRGRFRSIDELLEVRGIGPAKLDGLRGLVTV